MQVIFKTQSMTFCAEFNNTLTSRQFCAGFPVVVSVAIGDSALFFKTEINAVSLTRPSSVEAGDVVYISNNKCLAIFLNSICENELPQILVDSPWTKLGRILAFGEELKKLDSTELITIEVMSDEPANDSKKLSQSEIDVLIEETKNKK